MHKSEYFNTTHQTGREAIAMRDKAASQAEQILDFFELNIGRHYTPSEIRRFVFENTVPITSVRRAMTCLTRDRHLAKTGGQKTGPYGRPEYNWQLATGQRELF